MEPSCIDLYVFAGQSNVLGWGVGPLEMQRVLSAHRRLAGGAPVLLFEPPRAARRQRDAQAALEKLAVVAATFDKVRDFLRLLLLITILLIILIILLILLILILLTLC